jgi:hypothetical protein
LPFPRFDSKNDPHQKLAQLGKRCAESARRLLGGADELDLDARTLGRVRARLREQMFDDLAEIDVIVEQLSSGKTEAAVRASGKGRSRKGGRTLPLFD